MSINGETVTKYGPNCEKETENIDALDEKDKETIETIQKRMDHAWNHLKPGQKYFKATYTSQGLQGKMVENMAYSTHQIGKYRVDVYGKGYTVASNYGDLPFNWVRYFIFEDKVGIVSEDISLKMLPLKCLNGDQLSFINGIKDSLDKASASA